MLCVEAFGVQSVRPAPIMIAKCSFLEIHSPTKHLIL